MNLEVPQRKEKQPSSACLAASDFLSKGQKWKKKTQSSNQIDF